MKVVVLADSALKEELLSQQIQTGLYIEWINEPERFLYHADADGYIDLLFSFETARIDLLKKLSPKPVFVNLIDSSLAGLPQHIIRINGWPTFLSRSVTEASRNNDDIKQKAEDIFRMFNKKIEWVADVPGFIAARVVAMIINEAYLTLSENVSSKSAIDTAMKSGTNHPFGPFEWSEKIGLKNIASLLTRLSDKQERYKPAALLLKEAVQ